MSIHIEVPREDIHIPVTDRDLIPRKTGGIYKFYGEHGDVLYVGKATNLYQRISQHLSGGDPTSCDVYHNYKAVACIFVEDIVHREIYETYMINTLKPALNWAKVFTYTSQKFDAKYNPMEQSRRAEMDAAIDKSLEGFHL